MSNIIKKRAKYKHIKYNMMLHTVTPTISDVEILDEDKGSYKIRLCTSDVSNHVYGDILWVNKNEIIIPVS